MKASIVSDNSTRDIDLAIDGAPDLDVTESWARKPRIIRPATAQVHIYNGEPRTIKISGPTLLKNGEASELSFGHRTYSATTYLRPEDRLDAAPRWVRDIFTEAPLGVTTFTWIDEDAV